MKFFLRIVIVLLVILGLAFAAGWVWYKRSLQQAYQTTGKIQFEIKKGESSRTIINNLVERRLLENSHAVLIFARVNQTTFLAGTFAIPKKYTAEELLQLFQTEERRELKMTIPEGWTKEQIADELKQFELSGSEFLKLAEGSEGMLFPDTYNIGAATTTEGVYRKMKDQYAKKVANLPIGKNELILASIIEREAKTDEERFIIAGIYRNRLRIGMKLDADPTVQYAKYTVLGKAPETDGVINYWAPITRDDYTAVKSAYNTYLNAGLPPGPICNPGIKSLEAAANPAQTDALYFLHGKEGKFVTGRTLDEHNQNKSRFLQ